MKDQVIIAKHNIDNEPNTPTNMELEEFLQCYCLRMEN